MRIKKIVLMAEEQLVYGTCLPDVARARNALLLVLPEDLLAKLLDEKIRRMKAVEVRRRTEMPLSCI